MKKLFFLIPILVILLIAGIGFWVFSQAISYTVEYLESHIAYEGKEPYQYAAPWNKDMFDGFYVNKKSVPDSLGIVKGGIVPHHLLAGYIPATFFDTIAKQKPSVIVLISPNHFSRGTSDIIATEQDWKTPYGIVKTDRKMLKELVQKNYVKIDEAAMKEEHGVYGLIPFINKSLPKTAVVSLILKNDARTSTLDGLAQELKDLLPRDAVIVASIDFSHYQTVPVAEFHDEFAKSVIQRFDYDRLPLLEIDSIPSLYTLLKLMDAYDTEKIGFEIETNAGQLAGDPGATNITSYYSPYFVSGEREVQGAVSILHFGDIMIDRNVKKRIDEFGQDYLLGKLAGEERRFFQGMDMVSANLEGPFANVRRPTTKEIAFRFDPALILMLKKYNFSVFSQANNHSYDMGPAGFEESKENLKAAGIAYYGSEYRIDSDSLLIKQVGPRKVAFIGLNDTHAPIDIEDVIPLIKQAEKEADITIINIHWGVEYEELSHPRQRELAHAFIDAGVDTVIGHHPHVVQEVEIYNDRPIFYSLGNFLFDQYFSVPTQQGLAVGTVFHEDRMSVYLSPLQGNESQVTLMSYKDAMPVMQALVDRSRLGSYTFNTSHYLSIPISSYQ